MSTSFTSGTICGIALCAMLLHFGADHSAEVQGEWMPWVQQNLGASLWLFGAVLALFTLDLSRLRQQLGQPEQATLRDVVGLDQRLDVWSQLFIGIGVVWTAIGMRSALQAALGDGSGVDSSASSVLQSLVDGGILLALSTTIVGGVGGYLMRLVKTVSVGSALQAFYESLEQAGVRALLAATERIESHLSALRQPHAETPS